MKGGGDEVEPSIGVSLVGPVEVPHVEVVEEDRRAAPDSGDGVQPPARQAEHPVPVAFGLRRAVAHKDEPRRRGSGGVGGGSRGRGGAGAVLRRRLRWRARPLACRGGRGRRGGPRHGGGRRIGRRYGESARRGGATQGPQGPGCCLSLSGQESPGVRSR